MGATGGRPRAAAKALWSQGRWSEVAKHLDDASRSLVDACAVSNAHQVLDVAAGIGNAAAWAARRGARVVATDLTPTLVSEGRKLCRLAGLDVDWCEADMERLPFPDHAFDVVVCAFGIMYADAQATALGELFRVTRRGGTVGLVNWTPEGFQGQAAATVAKYSPSRRRGHDPMDWGREQRVLSWLKPYVADLHLERRAVWQEFASPDSWWEHASHSAPPLVSLRDVLGQERFAELGNELRGLLRAFDSGESGVTRWPHEYLMVVARKGTGVE